MKIAVTGGFGFVGRNVINKLLVFGHDIHVLSHRNQNSDLFIRDVTIFQGGLNDVDSLRSCFEDCDIVIHLVGIIAETRSKTFQNIVVDGSSNVVSAAKSCGCKKMIYMSAMGTSETAKSEYHRTKLLAEKMIISSGIDYTILRPSLIFGDGDGFVSMLVKMIKMSPFIPVIGDGKYKMQPVYIDDLTEAVKLSIENIDTNNKIIEVGGPEKLEYLEIIHILKDVMGKKRMNFFLPKLLMRKVASVLEFILKPAPITNDQITMMEAGNTGNIEDMRKILNIEPIVFKDGLKNI